VWTACVGNQFLLAPRLGFWVRTNVVQAAVEDGADFFHKTLGWPPSPSPKQPSPNARDRSALGQRYSAGRGLDLPPHLTSTSAVPGAPPAPPPPPAPAAPPGGEMNQALYAHMNNKKKIKWFRG
jgi:hypothetical protein